MEDAKKEESGVEIRELASLQEFRGFMLNWQPDPNNRGPVLMILSLLWCGRVLAVTRTEETPCPIGNMDRLIGHLLEQGPIIYGNLEYKLLSAGAGMECRE